MCDIVGKYSALCVLLQNGNSNTPHRESTNRQNGRMNNKTSATNLGELKELSREDLVESFKKKSIPEDHAKKLAECLVDEARTESQGEKQEEKTKETSTTRRSQTGRRMSAGRSVGLVG